MDSLKVRKFLLVDDDPYARTGVASVLQRAEPSAEILQTGIYQEAIELLFSQPIDIAIIDYDLRNGEKNGLDIVRACREKGSGTRLIMLSAETRPELVMECINAGASGYMTKGGQTSALQTAIDTVVADQIYVPRSVLSGNSTVSPASVGRRATVDASSLGLTPRETEALYFLCLGLSNKAIANHMGIEEKTLRQSYVTKIFQVLGVAKRTMAVLEVQRRGITVARPAYAKVGLTGMMSS